MKEYAVIVYFDENTTTCFYDLKQELYHLGWSDYFLTNPDAHLTLCSFVEMNELIFKSQLDAFTCRTFTLAGIGSFSHANIIFSSLVKNQELFALNRTLCEITSASPDSLYSPDNWYPHITIVNRVPEAHFLDAYGLCKHKMTLDKVHFSAIQVLAFDVDDAGRILSKHPLYTRFFA